jgi:hypothetical protein
MFAQPRAPVGDAMEVHLCDYCSVARRLALAAIIALVVSALALCARPRPEIGLTISGTTVPGSSGNCGDGGACPPPVAPLTLVRTTTPVRFDFVVGNEVDQISAAIWRGETMIGTVIETFTLEGGARSHTTTQLKPDGRYYIIANIRWSRFLDRGVTSRAFLVEIASP